MTDPPASTKERAQRADGPVRSVPAKEPCKPSDQRFSRLGGGGDAYSDESDRSFRLISTACRSEATLAFFSGGRRIYCHLVPA